MDDQSSSIALLVVQVLLGDIILRHFMGVHFFFVRVVSFFHTGDGTGLEEISLAYQFIDTFRVRLLGPGHTLQVSGLAA